MLRKALLASLVVCPGLTWTLAAFAAGPFFAPEPPATAGAPFSAVAQTQSTTVFADGNRIVRTNTVHYFRDAQGRTRVERATSSGEAHPGALMGDVITIDDPVAGERISLLPLAKVATVFKVPQGTTMPRLTSVSGPDATAPFGLLGFGMGLGANGMTTESSAETTSLGQKAINGVLATGTRVVRVIPTGVLGNEQPITSTLEEWRSAELGIPVQITEKSSIGGQLTFSLQTVAQGDPDPAEFTVPSDYKRHEINPNGPQVVAVPGEPVTLTAVKKP